MLPVTKEKASQLFLRAEKAEERGDIRSAFRLLQASARLGDVLAQINVGNYYDAGKGVRRNRSAALYWYSEYIDAGTGRDT